MVAAHLLGASARAFSVLVGPMSVRQALMALGRARTMAHTGPLVMNSTSRGKNGLP